MADWPNLEEFKLVLNIENDDWDDTLSSVLQSAIDTTKGDVGGWDELVDEPDDTLSRAALRMAELMSERQSAIPNVKGQLRSDPDYRTLMSSKKRRFSVA